MPSFQKLEYPALPQRQIRGWRRRCGALSFAAAALQMPWFVLGLMAAWMIIGASGASQTAAMILVVVTFMPSVFAVGLGIVALILPSSAWDRVLGTVGICLAWGFVLLIALANNWSASLTGFWHWLTAWL